MNSFKTAGACFTLALVVRALTGCAATKPTHASAESVNRGLLIIAAHRG